VVRTSELRVKDVVNVLDGRRLGAISDLELDLDTGRVTALVVPGPGRILGLFGRDQDLVVPWSQVRKIGVDVILVEVEGDGGGKARG
jgi:YlmC/YmxH family sporulation protein